MSQDNQNSLPPSTPKPEANQSQQMTERITQKARKPYQKVQPFWKAKAIQILRGTIGVLEATAEKLETVPPPGSEATPGFLPQIQLQWSKALAKIRSLLPRNLSAKLLDTTLTGVIAGILVILVWTSSSIFTKKPVEIANVPPPQEEPPVTITIPPQIETPSTLPVEETPPLAKEPSLPEPEPTPIPAQTPTPIPTQTPTVILTPEQTLIAAIENQVAEVSDRFASGLIQSIQADFRTSSLTMKINDDWYTLEQSQQDKLAAQMLQRSKELDFTHLDIIDTQNRLVARNPVVGDQIIVFQRRMSN
ncbi:MAG: hypothetical protein PUP92_12775 [Rhizonema sp. PD38]|nr:hypothetical protein [Rhizonema sp. PD38]